MALLEGKPPYWRQVLDYCVDGCLQAVLDEYAHVLHDHLGLGEGVAAQRVHEIATHICEAMSLRTANLGVSDLGLGDSLSTKRPQTRRMRCHFALRFGDERAEDGKMATRADSVRKAFNSPFWPFVVATTSVGQEGLDFHTYCHAVVHWNLPSNPVDLEQREGRVHRFKGHAVRKNIALAHGTRSLEDGAIDPWKAMFDEASRTRPDVAPRNQRRRRQAHSRRARFEHAPGAAEARVHFRFLPMGSENPCTVSPKHGPIDVPTPLHGERRTQSYHFLEAQRRQPLPTSSGVRRRDPVALSRLPAAGRRRQVKTCFVSLTGVAAPGAGAITSETCTGRHPSPRSEHRSVGALPQLASWSLNIIGTTRAAARTGSGRDRLRVRRPGHVIRGANEGLLNALSCFQGCVLQRHLSRL
ncbi:MAG: helicase-related protein [Deltaproteobacteria bacterium]